jgi:hypothetical protein
MAPAPYTGISYRYPTTPYMYPTVSYRYPTAPYTYPAVSYRYPTAPYMYPTVSYRYPTAPYTHTRCSCFFALTPSPSPTGWERGVGAHGGAPCSAFPLSRLRERGIKGVRAIQRTCWFTLALGKIAPASKTSCRTVVPLPAHPQPLSHRVGEGYTRIPPLPRGGRGGHRGLKGVGFSSRGWHGGRDARVPSAARAGSASVSLAWR